MRWDFAKLLEHWKKKHAQAAYVPCVKRQTGNRAYRYGRQVLLGVGADFTKVLQALSLGAVYYDPGIKLENASQPNAKSKRRSQFRVTSKNIPALYQRCTVIDVCDPAEADMIWKRP